MDLETTTTEVATEEEQENQEAQNTEGEPSFLEQLPEKYRNEKAFSSLKSFDDLCDQFANSQTLIGKKSIGVPETDAPREEWDKFFEKVKPDSPDKYEVGLLENVEGLSEEDIQALNSVITDDQKGFVKSMFHEAGLLPWQAKFINDKYNQFIATSYKEQLTAFQKQNEMEDVKFDELATNLFGNQKGHALNTARELIVKHFPSEYQETFLNSKSEFALGVVKMLNDIHKNYISEDSVVTTASDSKTSSAPNDLKAEHSALVSKLETLKQGTAEYDMVLAQKRDLAARMAKLQS